MISYRGYFYHSLITSENEVVLDFLGDFYCEFLTG